jgi:translation initiation factor IF-2
MSKVRVYELAKELGLENKDVIDLCIELQIDGKASHSNSLSDAEADKIRRHVIRSAVNDQSESVRQVRRSGEVLTERRVGGSVIRRRKKPGEAEDDGDIGDIIEQGPSTPTVPFVVPQRELPSLAPDLAAEKRQRDDHLRAANALFSNNTQSAPANTVVERQVEPAVVEVEEEVEELEAQPPEVEPVVNEDEAVIEADVEVEVEPVVAEAVSEVESLDDVRKRHDIRAPRILGRIELPTPPRPAERTAPTRVTPTEETTTETGTGPRSKTKKKKTVERDDDLSRDRRPKKKQVLQKGDLVDYDGERDGWRGKKDKKSKRGEDGRGLNGAEAIKQGIRTAKIDGEISVGEFAKQLGVKAGEVVARLMQLGTMATINQVIDFETASLVAEALGGLAVNTNSDVDEYMLNLRSLDQEAEKNILRPPVVTVMGHVDHGKTSLLDAIRKTSVTSGEFGGITQHIGAYNVKLASGGSVTLLDTPGHEAFTAMRSRGAQLTDIVVLVVAADDGVMPQTIEAINHAKAANVPIIVAVNKIDKEGANPDKVINQLSEHGLVPEDWGGQTIICRVSAHTREGLDNLLENLHLQAEILELRANPDRAAFGTVVESRLDKGRGTVITILVQGGTLKKGDTFVAGAVFGRVKAMMLDDGTVVDEAGPSIPVEILGASASGEAGDDFAVIQDEPMARKIAEERAQKRRRKVLAASARGGFTPDSPLTLERFSEMVGESVDVKELPLIVKADVQGSAEAVHDALIQLSNEEVRIKVIHKAVGGVTENDVQLASASKAIIVAFNVRPDARAAMLIESEGVDILYSRVIYDLVDNIESAVKGKMAPKYQEKQLGRMEVRQTFKVPKLGMIAGSYVTSGTVPRTGLVRLLRDGKVVFEGKLASLKRFKDDVREVKEGYECGVGLDGFSDIKDGDVMEVYTVEEIRQ